MSAFPQCSPRGSKIPKVLSYGGGLDSFAMLLLAIQNGNKPDWAVFVDTGDSGPSWGGGKGSGLSGQAAISGTQGEWPSTYKHIRQVVMPLCKKHGINFAWLTYKDYPIRHCVDADSLLEWFEKSMRASGGQTGFPVKSNTRMCTTVAKVERFERWLNDHYPGQQVEVWIGFEAGEEKRAGNDPNVGKVVKFKSGKAVRRNCFPLMEAQLCRCRAKDFVQGLGYAVPEKSACVFCPFNPRSANRQFKKFFPGEFRRMERIEQIKPRTERGMRLSITGYETILSKTEYERDEHGNIKYKRDKATGVLKPVMKAVGSVFMPLGESIKDIARAEIVPAGGSGEVQAGFKIVKAGKPKLGAPCPICHRYHSLECPKSVGCDPPGERGDMPESPFGEAPAKGKRLPVVRAEPEERSIMAEEITRGPFVKSSGRPRKPPVAPVEPAPRARGRGREREVDILGSLTEDIEAAVRQAMRGR